MDSEFVQARSIYPCAVADEIDVCRWQSRFDLKGRFWRDGGIGMESALQVE